MMGTFFTVPQDRPASGAGSSRARRALCAHGRVGLPEPGRRTGHDRRDRTLQQGRVSPGDRLRRADRAAVLLHPARASIPAWASTRGPASCDVYVKPAIDTRGWRSRTSHANKERVRDLFVEWHREAVDMRHARPRRSSACTCRLRLRAPDTGPSPSCASRRAGRSVPRRLRCVEMLRARAAVQPDDVAYTFLETARRGRRADLGGTGSRRAGGRRDGCRRGCRPAIARCCSIRRDSTSSPAFFGCLYAGVLAVPVHAAAGRAAGPASTVWRHRRRRGSRGAC